LERVGLKAFFLRFVDFPSKERLAERLMVFMDERNETAHPFLWTTKAVAEIMLAWGILPQPPKQVPLDDQIGSEGCGEVPERRLHALGHGRIRFRSLYGGRGTQDSVRGSFTACPDSDAR
jgi:hypothetical protein